MAPLPSSSQVTFAKKKRLRLPFQSPHTPVPGNQVLEQLEKGDVLAVKGPEQSNFLPLKSPQDLDEFLFFHEGRTDMVLENQDLAAGIKELQSSGAQFWGLKGNEERRIGAYGAYNQLTEELEFRTLSVAFDQVLPRRELRSRRGLRELLSRVRAANSLTEATSPELRAHHWALLYEASLRYESDAATEWIVKRASQKLRSDGFENPEREWAMAEALFSGFEGSRSRGAIIERIAGERDPKGERKISLDSFLILHEAALITKTDRDFYRQTLRLAPDSESYSQLGQALMAELFPAQGVRVQTLFPEAIKEHRELFQAAYLETQLRLPNSLENPRWLALQTARELEQREFGSELVNKFLRIALPALTKEHPRMAIALTLVDSAGPTGKGLVPTEEAKVEVMKKALDFRVDEVSFSASCLLAAPCIEDRERIAEILLRRLQPEKAQRLQQWLGENTVDSGTRRLILASALGVKTPVSGRGSVIPDSLLREHYPHRCKAIESITAESPPSSLQLHQKLLCQAALASSEELSSAQLALKACDFLTLSSFAQPDDYYEALTQFLKTAVMAQQKHDPRARLIKELVDKAKNGEKVSSGERWNLRDHTLRDLYGKVLQRELSPVNFLDQVYRDTPLAERRQLLLALGPPLLPELHQVVESLVQHSPEELRAGDRVALFEIGLDAQRSKEGAMEMLERADHMDSSRATRFWRAILQNGSENSPRARELWNRLEHDKPDFKEPSTLANLVRNALDEGLSGVEFFNRCLGKSRGEERGYLTKTLGGILLGEPGLAEVPSDIKAQLESGGLSPSEFLTVYETLKALSPVHKPAPPIDSEDDFLVVDGTWLEVDL